MHFLLLPAEGNEQIEKDLSAIIPGPVTKAI